MMLSIVIPTYRREEVLISTLNLLQPLRDCLPCRSELLLIDQTEEHASHVNKTLSDLSRRGVIRWIRFDVPHLTRAMNHGLCHAQGDIILYLDDDIIPFPNLLCEHLDTHLKFPDAWAVVGQILQPGQEPVDLPQKPHPSLFWRDLDFPFNSMRSCWIANAMAGNLSLKRSRALSICGFDESIPPPVAARFESEFAKRLIASGGMIRFSPKASLRHLAASSGGTRSRGSHLTSASSCYGVGDYYFALRCATGVDRFWYLLRKPFREVRTRFHLRHPWWIPVKLIGELRAFFLALRLTRRPPLLMSDFQYSDVIGQS